MSWTSIALLWTTARADERSSWSDTEMYKAELSDGRLVFTDMPTGPGFVRIGEGGLPIPKPTQVSTRTFPLLDSWDERFVQAEARYGVPAELLKAVCLAESGMNPNALSYAGAQGLMQLMPGTAAQLGVRDPWDPWENIDGGARYIKQMSDLFGDWQRTIAAYHAGPANVTKYDGIPPFPDTQAYVAKVLDLYDYFKVQRPVDRRDL